MCPGRRPAATMSDVPRDIPAPTEQMIAALIPAPLPRSRPSRPPLPRLPAPRTLADPAEPQLDVSRLDPSGRISTRPLLRLLHWTPGHRLRFDAFEHTITATSSRTGTAISASGLLAIPVAVRHLGRLATGDTVVLLADPAHDLLVIHPARIVARLLTDRLGGADAS
ncbi:hypothetical protein GCM10022255_069070 [Dactylosporangium darangshiense]|uniref:SpoVT-AbrB domain-containing protein n=2 Tax=Dactylosporangium darangshiense TaxID=579108 RepID=A0ABP8DI27_9ACTN